MSTGAPMGGGVITGRDGVGNPIVTYYASGPTAPTAQINVWDYWQETDQWPVLDHALMFNRAIAAGAAMFPQGFQLYAPTYTYILNSPIIINLDNVQLVGDGWSTQFTPSATFPAGPMIQVVWGGQNGVFRYGILIGDLFVNCNNVAGVSGIELDSTYNAILSHLRIRYCQATSINLSGNTNARGAYTHIIGCHITDGAAGTGILTSFHEDVFILGGLIAHFQSTGGVGFKSQDGVNHVAGTVFDNCDTAVWLSFCSANRISDCEFTNGLTHFINFNGATECLVTSCYFNSFLGTGAKNMIDVSSSAANNIVQGCRVESGTGWTNFIHESGASPANLYANNNTAGLPIVFGTGSTGIARGNVGYNPRGLMTAPTIPASGTPLTNPFGVDSQVIISTLGGLTALAIGGTAVVPAPAAGSSYRIPAGQTVTLTWATTAPTWQWYGD